MDDTVDLSADVPQDASAYVSDAIDSTGSAVATAQEATNQIQSALGFAQSAVGAVSGVLGSYGIKVGGVNSPTAKPAITATPQPVQVGSTQQNTNPSTILYILLAAAALLALVFFLG